MITTMICFFTKDADDDFNLPYILYSDYLKYMNGEFDSTDDETKNIGMKSSNDMLEGFLKKIVKLTV